jgi:phage-related holin
MNTIVAFLQTLVNLQQAETLVALLVANVVFEAIDNAKKGNFKTADLVGFLKQTAIVFLYYLSAGVIAHVLTNWTAVQIAAWALLMGNLLQNLLKVAKDLGLPVPDNIPVIDWLPNVIGVGISKKKTTAQIPNILGVVKDKSK